MIALVVALAVSMTSRINVGWLGLAFAWLIGVYAAGLRVDAVMAGFPTALFITLTGVTLLFAIAETNQSLEALAARALRLARGSVRVIPLLMFLIACLLSSVGFGAVSTVALIVPLAMVMGERVGLSPFLTALMVANSERREPFALFLGGCHREQRDGESGAGRLRRARGSRTSPPTCSSAVSPTSGCGRIARRWARDRTPVAPPVAPLTPRQRLTLVVVALWIAGVLGLNLNLGFSAFAAAALLLVIGAADETTAVRRVPWAIVMMVCGVSVLIGLLEQTGGMDLFTDLLAGMASVGTLNGVIAFVTGAISTYSSTSGVVLPAFLPTAPALVAKVGGGDPLAVALSINVGSSLVDVSPLSTIGALCVAAGDSR